MKAFYIIFTLSFLSANTSGQITIPDDSVKILLSHKWGIDRITMGGQPINSSGETVTYEFLKDGTFNRVTDKKTENGTWTYEPEKKWVHLKIKKKTNIYITSLKEKEFKLTANNNKEPVEGDQFGINAYFKIISL